MKTKLPIKISDEEQLRKLWAEFKEYMLAGTSGHATPNQKTRLTGAALFVDFLCGILPTKRNSATSYLKYPEDPWPIT